MLPAHHICERARLSRDPRFDGAFFIGVVTTGVYCRPVCPVRQPAAENVRYLASAAAAEEAGFRPCRRCLPERAARVPEWCIGSRTVIRGLRLIDAGALDDAGVDALAARLGITARHLNRLFHDELGATPKRLAVSRRRALAKRLIDDTDLPFTGVAYQAGYRSLRRFNDDVRRCFGRSPGAIRAARRRQRPPLPDRGFALRLPIRQPYDVDWVFDFLKRRALAGFEAVDGRCYRRCVLNDDGSPHWIGVSWHDDGLILEVPDACTAGLGDLLPRVRRVFDLDADSRAIDLDLATDPVIGDVVARHPGLRVPGAWDGFETAVRAVLGQQVSVDRATALAHRLQERFGRGCLQRPEALAGVTAAEIGMPGRRGRAISLLAAETAAGRLDLHDGADPGELSRALCGIPGIGPWTAGYVTMRVAKDPDAYPVNDWVVLKMLEAAPGLTGSARSAAAGRQGSHAERWRPWRAYAVMYLWKRSQTLRDAQLARQA